MLKYQECKLCIINSNLKQRPTNSETTFQITVVRKWNPKADDVIGTVVIRESKLSSKNPAEVAPGG